MSTKQVPAFMPPAGATPNELASSGPGSAAALDVQAAFAHHREAQRAADARQRVIEADRPAVERAFVEHVAELAMSMLAWPELGALGGAAGGGVLGLRSAFRSPPREGREGETDPALQWDRVLWAVVGGAAGGAVAGALVGVFVGEVWGPRRPRVSSALPPDVEAKLVRRVQLSETEELLGVDAPPWLASLGSLEAPPPVWRIEGWRETWAVCARAYAVQTPHLEQLLGALAPAVIRPVLREI